MLLKNFKTKSVKAILGIALISIFLMYLIEVVISAGYINKSVIKIVLFLIVPIIYTLFDKTIKVRDYFKIKSWKSLGYSFLLGIGIYMGILGVYFILKSFIDLSNIIAMLDRKAGVDKDNFIWIALYISLINSLLEEFFFRGFIFLNLKKTSVRKFAYLVSTLVFSVYHVAIMGSWFDPIIFIVAMVGLFVGAFIFNFLNEKEENIYNSWIVHMMANLSINTVGLMMFGIL
ncbi:MAG TPA: CPBP family intramembrane metalloprotease [Epulopiscium sp.]|nr:CPBP family intramembrane metalloprotease [Candidatus Epulonipiscium sp.]